MILSHHEREERVEARVAEFKTGQITEPVFRASLFALRYRGDDIDFAVNANRPESKR